MAKRTEKMCHGTQMTGTRVRHGALLLSFQAGKQDTRKLACFSGIDKYRSFLQTQLHVL